MATLIIDGMAVELEGMTLTYPTTFSGDSNAYSTDFDLADTPEMRQALGIVSLLSLERQGRRRAATLLMGYKSHACYITPTEIGGGNITCSLQVYFFPEVFNRRICDLAAESGNDVLFEYGAYVQADTWPVELDGYAYATGVGNGIDGSGDYVNSRQLPSMTIQTFALWVRLVTGLNIDFSTITDVTDTYITLATLRHSPLVRTLIFDNWHSDTSHEFIVGEVSTNSGIITLKPLLQGIKRLKLSAYNPTTDDYIVNIYRGTTLYATVTVTPGESVIFDAVDLFEVNDEFTFSYSPNLIFMFERPDAPNGWGEDVKVQMATYNNILHCFDRIAPHQFGFFGCITATVGEVLRDIATHAGRLMTYDGDTIRFEERTTKVINCSTDGFEFGSDAFGKDNYVSFAGEEFAVARYDGDTLQDNATLVELTASRAGEHVMTIGGGDYKEGVQEVWNGSDFVANGEYFINHASRQAGWGQSLLTAKGVDFSKLIPQRSELITLKATTMDDISDATVVETEGRDWLLTEREVDDNGVTEFTAVLMR